jgi:hypothetical protein
VCGHLCNVQHVLINTALCYKFILFCICKCWSFVLTYLADEYFYLCVDARVCMCVRACTGYSFVCSVLIFCVYCSYLYILLGIAYAAIYQVCAVLEMFAYVYQCVYPSCANYFRWFFRCTTFIGCLNVCPSSTSLWYPWYRLSCHMCVLYLIYDFSNQSCHCYFWWLECAPVWPIYFSRQSRHFVW